jgi:hypothetical protein
LEQGVDVLLEDFGDVFVALVSPFVVEGEFFQLRFLHLCIDHVTVLLIRQTSPFHVTRLPIGLVSREVLQLVHFLTFHGNTVHELLLRRFLSKDALSIPLTDHVAVLTAGHLLGNVARGM